MGAQSRTSILELVSDPWLRLVYLGIYLMLFGGVLMFVFGVRRK
jgi:cytochrome c biogenesis factor